MAAPERPLLLFMPALMLVPHIFALSDELARGATSLPPPPTHSGAFEVLFSGHVSEQASDAVLYKHVLTGAELLSFASPNHNEKVFGITFRTPPNNSKGVPHILEHSVLAGSRQYRTKEPFVDLLKGSLQTFLNAMTYPDRTCYPVASQNTKDFYNLANVYLDAVFHPRALTDPTVLAQEGWHFELENISKPLVYKGVVFNEMKGLYSSPEALLDRELQQALFPDISYGVDSGGDPKDITKLTHAEFVQFHSSFYHPGNARLFFWGDDPVADRLALADQYLQEFGPLSASVRAQSTVQYQPPFAKPVQIDSVYPAKASSADAAEISDQQYYVQMAWVVNTEPLPAHEELALVVLDQFLMGTGSAPLRKALTDSGLGTAVIGYGYDSTLQQAVFSVGLKGVKSREDAIAVEKLVLGELAVAANVSPELDAIEAAVNTVEFGLREVDKADRYGPIGLMALLEANKAWVYDRDPLTPLRYEAPLERLKSELLEQKMPVLERLIEQYLLSNNHRVTVILAPDSSLEARLLEEEAAELKAIKETMKTDNLVEVVTQTQELIALQAAEDSPAAKATIPRLSLADLDRKQPEIPLTVENDNDPSRFTLLRHELQTAGILYADIGLDLLTTPFEMATDLLPLFSRLLLETGTSSMSRVSLTQRIGACTGGMQASFVLKPKLNAATMDAQDAEALALADRLAVPSPSSVSGLFLLRGKAVTDRVADLFELFKEVLIDANLGDRIRVVELLKEQISALEARFVERGHSMANTRMSQHFALTGHFREATAGYTALQTARRLLQQAQQTADPMSSEDGGSGWHVLHQRLLDLRTALLSSRILINLSGDAAALAAGDKIVATFANALPSAGVNDDHPSWKEAAWKEAAWMKTATDKGNQRSSTAISSVEGFAVQTQVNYVGQAGRLWAIGEQIPGAAAVAASFLHMGYLWNSVRVIGGAYGAMASLDLTTGTMSLLSYRDPNLAATLEIYGNAGGDLIRTAQNLSAAALEQAIIGAIGTLDSPLPAEQKGYMSLIQWLTGESAAMRQRWRDEMLATSVDDLVEIGKRLQASLNGLSSVSAVVGSAAAFETAAADGIGLSLATI